MYYTSKKIRSYNAECGNLIIAERGIGKTTLYFWECLYDCIKNNQSLVYARHTQPQIANTIKNDCLGLRKMVTDIALEDVADLGQRRKLAFLKNYFEDKIIKYSGNVLWFDEEPLIYVLPLTANDILRGIKYNSVRHFIFDEFLPKRMYKIHRDIIDNFVDVLESVIRLNDVKVWMLGNALYLHSSHSILNKLGFNLKDFGIYTKYDEYGLFCVCEYVNTKLYTNYNERHRKSTAGRWATNLKMSKLNENTQEFNSQVIEDVIDKSKYNKNLALHFGNGDYVVIGQLKRGLSPVYNESFIAFEPFKVKGKEFVCKVNFNVNAHDKDSIHPYFSQDLHNKIKELMLKRILYFDGHNSFGKMFERFVIEPYIIK